MCGQKHALKTYSPQMCFFLIFLDLHKVARKKYSPNDGLMVIFPMVESKTSPQTKTSLVSLFGSMFTVGGGDSTRLKSIGLSNWIVS